MTGAEYGKSLLAKHGPPPEHVIQVVNRALQDARRRAAEAKSELVQPTKGELHVKSIRRKSAPQTHGEPQTQRTARH